MDQLQYWECEIYYGWQNSSLSKELGQFFDATDSAKKQLQKKGVSGSNVTP